MFNIAKLNQTMWKRHANPLSGWCRVGLGALIVIAIWSHSLLFIGIIVVAILTNPWWFPPPQQSTDNFMFHVVVGECIWLNETKRWVKFATALGGSVIFFLLVYALWTHDVWLSLVCLAVVVVWKGLFVRYAANLSRVAGDTRLERAGISL